MQDVLDYLDGNFAVPDSGFESDVTWTRGGGGGTPINFG